MQSICGPSGSPSSVQQQQPRATTTRAKGPRTQTGSRSASKTGKTGRSHPQFKRDHVKPVVVVQQKRKQPQHVDEETVSNGYYPTSTHQHPQRLARNGGHYPSFRKGSTNGRSNGHYNSENLIFYPTNYRKSRPLNLNGGPPSLKCTVGQKAAPAKRVLEVKTNDCLAREPQSSDIEQAVPFESSASTADGVEHLLRTESTSSRDEICGSDSSMGGAAGDVAMDTVVAENSTLHKTDPPTNTALESPPPITMTTSDKDAPPESHADEEFVDALSNLGDNDDQKESSVVTATNSAESSVSSSAYATPGTCSGTASPPVMPPGNPTGDSLLATVLEKKLLGLVNDCPPRINGLTGGSNSSGVVCGGEDGESLGPSLVAKAGSDSGVEEAQFNDDDAHEDGSCTDASIGLFDDLSSSNGVCGEEGSFFVGGSEQSLSKNSPSHKEDSLDLVIGGGTSKVASDSDLPRRAFRLVSATTSSGNSPCSTGVSSPAPSSPSPPPAPPTLVLLATKAKEENRQPVCTLAGDGPTLSSLSVLDKDVEAPPEERGKELLPSLPPLLVHSDSAPDFPCLPLPGSPVPTAAPVQHSLSKHPLHTTWVMSYYTSAKPHFANYAAELQHLSSVCHVEEFWSVFNNILYPSELPNNSDYHFFKKGIQPLWEDPANKHGGRWVLTVKSSTQHLDSIWMEILMALIGEHITKSHYISGVVVSRRKKGDRIALWTTDKKVNINLHICKQFLRVLALACCVSEEEFPRFVQDLAEEKQGMALLYAHHQDSLRSGSSYQSPSHVSLRDNLLYLLDSSTP